jgi:transposase
MSKSLEDLKKFRLVKVLKQTGGNRTLAADKLDVSVRTIRNWIKKYDLLPSFPVERGRKPL